MDNKPYKIRRPALALNKENNPGAQLESPVNITVADAPAELHDQGLYAAWRFVMVAVPVLLALFISYDKICGWLASFCPQSQGAVAVWLRGMAAKDNLYRQFFMFMPDGLAITFQITMWSVLVAVSLGIITGLCRISKIRPVHFVASCYVEVVRGIPLMVQLFYIYYAIGNLVTVPPMVTAVSAISFCYGAYMGEVVRGGIEAIDRGQREAAMCLGFTPFQAMIYVVLPQALRAILPPIGNECIALLKDSSMVSIVGVPDIMRRAREYASTTFAYFEAYTTVTLVYLFMTLLLSRLVAVSEARMGKNERH